MAAQFVPPNNIPLQATWKRNKNCCGTLLVVKFRPAYSTLLTNIISQEEYTELIQRTNGELDHLVTTTHARRPLLAFFGSAFVLTCMLGIVVTLLSLLDVWNAGRISPGGIGTGIGMIIFGIVGTLATLIFQRRYQNSVLWQAMDIMQSNADAWLRKLGPRPIMYLRVMTGPNGNGVDFLSARANAGCMNMRIDSFWLEIGLNQVQSTNYVDLSPNIVIRERMDERSPLVQGQKVGV